MKRYNTHGQKLRFPPSEKAQFLTECDIFHLRPGGCSVDTTVCKGKILMKNKKILVLDEERIAARSRELAPQVWKRL